MEDVQAGTELGNVPTNQENQLERISRQYEVDGNGIPHGVQKDAIQNGLGARRYKDEVKAFAEWEFHFELRKIKGKLALIFWDQGTHGLTGQILTDDEIERLSAERKLGNPEERLSRFRSIFESGGNTGPGSFGQGKLIFQVASQDCRIIVDSVREDGAYLAFERLMQNTRLRQTKIPLKDEAAKAWLKEQYGSEFKPLTKPGTRLAILNVKGDLAESFKAAFSETPTADPYFDNFSWMIQETWWEIIAMGAKIFLHMDGEKKQIHLNPELAGLVEAADDVKGYKVHRRQNIVISHESKTYKIKEVRLVAAPGPIVQTLQGIFVQRKRMKIGSVGHLARDKRLEKRMMGIVRLEPELEALIEEKESTTHYSFDAKAGIVRRIKDAVRGELEKFQAKLGYVSAGGDGGARQQIQEVLKDLNAQARDLGLLTDVGSGVNEKDFGISIKSFRLPNEGTTRVDIGQAIGPVEYKIENRLQAAQQCVFKVDLRQGKGEPAVLLTKDVGLAVLGNVAVTLDPAAVVAPPFRAGEAAILRAVLLRPTGGEPLAQVSRVVWIGMDAPQRKEDPAKIVAYRPLWPIATSTRVELGQKVQSIRFKVVNCTAQELTLNIDAVARRAKSDLHDVKNLKELLSIKSHVLSALSEAEFSIDELLIDEATFGEMQQEPQVAKERKCELYFSARAAMNYPNLGIIKGQHLAQKRALPFYLGVDPAGSSIFKDTADRPDEKDPRRSWREGNQGEGYIFCLNSAHPAYKAMEALGDDAKQSYIRERMLFDAYRIAVELDRFEGPLAKYKEDFKDNDPAENIEAFDRIVGEAMGAVS